MIVEVVVIVVVEVVSVAAAPVEVVLKMVVIVVDSLTKYLHRLRTRQPPLTTTVQSVE